MVFFAAFHKFYNSHGLGGQYNDLFFDSLSSFGTMFDVPASTGLPEVSSKMVFVDF